MTEWQDQQRRADDAAWRAQYQDLKAREAFHQYALRVAPLFHDGTLADCPSHICRGEVPVPR